MADEKDKDAMPTDDRDTEQLSQDMDEGLTPFPDLDDDAISEDEREAAHLQSPVIGKQVYQNSDTEDAQWYVIHTYSGYENKVKATLEQVVENRGLHEYIQEIEIPVEEIVEMKDGKKKTSLRKIYPGYALVKMVLTDEIWYIVRNTRGVTGFVGPNSRPIPLTDEELVMMGVETDWEPVVDYGPGDSVKVISGPLDGFIGAVTEVSMERKKVTVLVSMFGRETPVELEFTQVLRT